MKRLLLTVLVLLNLLFWTFPVLGQLYTTPSPTSVVPVFGNTNALTPVPTLGVGMIPGLNCGYAGIAGKDSCCVSKHPEVDLTNTWMTFFENIPLIKVLQFIGDSFSQQRNKLGIIDPICQFGVPDSDPAGPSCHCINAITPSPTYLGALNSFCQSQFNLSDRTSCLTCANAGGVYSGIGCVKTDFKSFIEETVFGVGIGLAGGFSLLCIIYAAFMMQSSEGNPEKLKKAQEMITSCIIGLMLIIFSVFILRLIGVNILKIPGFGN